MLLGSPWTTNYGSLTAFNLLIGKNYASLETDSLLTGIKKKKEEIILLLLLLLAAQFLLMMARVIKVMETHTLDSHSVSTLKEASPELLKSDKLQLKKRHLNSNLLKIKLNTQ